MLAREKIAPAGQGARALVAGRRPGLGTLAVLAAAGIAGVGACDQPSITPVIRTLDGPAAMAFTCYGRMRVTSGEEASKDQAIVNSAMPVSACQAWNDAAPPPGQERLDGEAVDQTTWRSLVNVYGFVLQKQQGTLAVVQSALNGQNDKGEPIPGQFGLIDADRFSPGLNAIPMGTLPVGVATDPTGCHVMTANAGSCDLSILDVNSALDLDRRPEVQRIDIVNAGGERIGARPRAVVAQPGDAPVGFVCEAAPDSLVYVAYPDCNMVAVVHAGTGVVQAGIVFREDGTVALTDGQVSCGATTCGGLIEPSPGTGPDAGPGADPDAGMEPGTDMGLFAGISALREGAPRPVALFVDEVDAGSLGMVRRLYIGADNSPQVTVVELDEAHLPVDSWSVPLEGEIGVTALAATEVIRMGGADGRLGSGAFGNFRFVYAIATDKTVRVAEVHTQHRECDTQIDPRSLRDVRNGRLLACLPVGDPTWPRRAGAISPGIHMPGNALPLGVAFAAANGNLIGHFAFITMSTGGALVVNVDDDRYPDFEDQDDPLKVDISQAMAHQVRDVVIDRSASLYCRRGSGDMDAGVVDEACDYETPVASCNTPTSAVAERGPRLGSASPGQIITAGDIAVGKLDHLPTLRQVTCSESERDVPVSELSFMAPDYLRAYAYPDRQRVANETWTLTWEGRISRDSTGSATVRLGYLTADRGIELRDGSEPFCRMGAEPYDLVTLIGCDPSRGNAQCKLGEVCYVHPDTPATISTGMCLPGDQVSALAESCRDLLISRRRYTVLDTHASRLVLGERRRALRTTPVDGCIDATQCVALHAAERALRSEEEQVNLCLPGDEADSPYTWACEADPTRAPGPDRCLMTCAQDDDCEQGWLCSGGYCVEGKLPPAECLGSAQRYDLRVGEAFAAVGTSTGFLHPRMADPDTGACIDDPDAHPLRIGRVPLTAPPCPQGDITGPDELDTAGPLVPNPCAVAVSHAEPVDQERVRTREATAIRFRNQAFTVHLVDPVLEATCGAQEPEVAVPAVFQGYELSFPIVGGFTPLQVALSAQIENSTFRVRYPISITRGPLGNLWITDQGDFNAAIKGQLLRIDSRAVGVQVPGIQ